MRRTLAALVCGTALSALATAASAVDLRYTCYSDANECEVMRDLLMRFHEQNPDITVTVDEVPYKAILESLPVQLAAGEGPDLARVTDLGGLNQYYLDLAPYVDRGYWEKNFGSTQPWFRSGPEDDGIYGMMTQLTITGAFVDKTLFDQAGIEMPGVEATWEDWAAATQAVAQATQTPYPMAIDRSGHRIAGPAISYGATFFDEAGKPRVVDEGFTAFARQFVAWNKDGVMDRDVWASQGGASYQDAAQQFVNGEVVLYYSGSWQIRKIDDAVGDLFDWVVVPSPCGPATCTAMPGGAALVGFKETEHPEAVAKVIDYFASEPVYAELTQRTRNIPAHQGIAAKELAYPDASPPEEAALKTFAKEVARISPVAFKYQGYKYNRAMFNATVTRLSQAIVGELELPAALERIDQDVQEAIQAAK